MPSIVYLHGKKAGKFLKYFIFEWGNDSKSTLHILGHKV